MSAFDPDISASNVDERKRVSRKFFGGWKRLAFANSATRREAKAILFVELGEATRRGMPLDVALEKCMLTSAEIGNASTPHSDTGPMRLFQTAQTLAYIFLTAFGAMFILLLTSVWAADVERVARVLALRLLPLIKAGHSLSAAMEMLPADYSREEVSTIRAGEEWNNLPAALKKLGEFQYYEREIQRHWARMVYPVWLSCIVLVVLEFIAIFIVPKFQDIYDQLGVELPASTEWLITFGRFSVLLGPAILIFMLWLTLLFFTLRLFMVGNRVLRDLMSALLFLATMWIAISLSIGMTENSYFDLSPILMFVVVVLAGVLGIYAGRYLTGGMEKFVLWLERKFSLIFGRIPVIGAPRRTELESRWLGALSLALSSGVAEPQAVQSAGEICGADMAERSRNAADLISQGHSIGAAALQTRVLRPAYINRLRLLDGRPDYTDGLAAIAEDAARESFHTMNRASRIAEVASVCLIGLIASALAFAMYMPLFTIPLVVGAFE